MRPFRVAVLRGGPSPEYDVSLRTGAHFLNHLAPRAVAHDIFISKAGEWYEHGVPTSPEKLFPHIDLVLSALHGSYGEDGKIQQLLEQHGIPYVGSGPLASALGMQKHLARERFREAGLRVPRTWVVRPEELDDLPRLSAEIHRTVAPPWVVKPSGAGSSLGVEFVWDHHALASALERAFFLSPVALIEEYIRGEEATVLVLDDFRGHTHYAFFPVHIRKSRWQRYTTEDKRDGALRMECPASAFSFGQKEELAGTARRAHTAIGARDLSRVDMIVNPSGVYLLEVNTIPSFGDHTPAGYALRAAGVSDADLLHHLITRARSRI